MAVQSMTGYGRGDEVGDGFSVTVELKSVNNRFLEFQIRSSKTLLHIEPKLKQELSKHITRGSLTCHIQYETQGQNNSGLRFNEPVLRAYTALVKEAQKHFGESATLNISDLLKVPDILIASETSEPMEISSERILPVFEKACLDLVAMREKEGQVLSDDMENRIRAFFPGLEKIKALVPIRQQEYVTKMRARLQELIGGITLAEDRVVTEIGLMAEKLDLTEEIVRLETHLHHFLETIATHKSPGKRLGFLLQEMLREVNTMGTKSQFSDMQHQCISWKEELEIIREQIQNIE